MEGNAKNENALITADLDDGEFYIKFAYDPILVSAVKENLHYKTRKWDSSHKRWVFKPRKAGDLEDLKDFADKYNFEITEEAQQLIISYEEKYRELAEKRKQLAELSAKAVSNIEIPNIKEGLDLYPFQKAGVEYAEKQGGRVLIADEMGLGKTIQAIGYLALHPELRPAIIVCPAFLKENWRREIEKWLDTDDKVEVIKGKRGTLPDASILIINYDIIDARKEQVKAIKPQVLIFDEAHYLKNWKAKRTKAIQEIVDEVKPQGVIALTGTPIMNRPIELWSLINLIKAGSFGKFWHYAERYCNAHKTRYGWDLSGASNLDELHVKLRETLMIRRLKKDVLAELPEKRRIPVLLSLNGELKEYREAQRNFYSYLIEKYSQEKAERSLKAEMLTIVNELRKILAKAKVKATVEWLNNFLESTEEKVVVFVHHRFMIDELKQHFPDALIIEGGMSAEDRQKAVDSFQNDPTKRIIIATIGSAGVGLTLTASHTAVFVEFEWRPADMIQAEDRIHRIGQEDRVEIYYLVAKDTIDMQFMDTLNEKLSVMKASLDGIPEDDENGVLLKIIEDMGIETDLQTLYAENSQAGVIME